MLTFAFFFVMCGVFILCMTNSVPLSRANDDKIVGHHRTLDAAVPATVDMTSCNTDEPSPEQGYADEWLRTSSVRRSTEIIGAPIARWLGLAAFMVVSLAIIASAIWLTRS